MDPHLPEQDIHAFASSPSLMPLPKEPPPPPPPPASYKRIMIVILIGLVFIGGITGACGYILWKNNKLVSELIIYPDHVSSGNYLVDAARSSSATWNIYQDTVYGFEVKYPEEMKKIQETIGMQKKVVQANDIFMIQDNDYETPFDISEVQIAIDTTNGNSLDVIQTLFSQAKVKAAEGITDITPATVHGYQAVKLLYDTQTPAGDGDTIHTTAIGYMLVSPKKYLYRIYFPYKKLDQKDQEFITEFLNNFSFL